MSYYPPYSATPQDIARNNITNVESLDDIFNNSTSVVGKVITPLDTAEYVITTNDFSFEDYQVKIPDSGQVAFRAANRFTNVMKTELTGNTPFIIGDISRLLIEDIVVQSVNDANLFDANSTTGGIITLQRSRVQGFDSLGTLDGTLFQTIALLFLLNNDGITLNDSGIISMEGTNFALQGGDHITLTGDVGTARFFNIAAAPSTGDAFFNFNYDTITDLTVTQCPFNGANGGTYLAAGSKDQEELTNRFFANVGAQNSYWIAAVEFEESSAVTTINAVDTYVDISGTGIASSVNERFSVLGNVITYIGSEPLKVKITLSASVERESGSAARDLRTGIFVDDTKIFSKVIAMVGTPRDLSVQAVYELRTGEEIKGQTKNEQSTDNVVFIDYSLVVEEA